MRAKVSLGTKSNVFKLDQARDAIEYLKVPMPREGSVFHNSGTKFRYPSFPKREGKLCVLFPTSVQMFLWFTLSATLVCISDLIRVKTGSKRPADNAPLLIRLW